MDQKTLAGGKVLFVVLKPYATERRGLGIYHIKDDMFEPNRRTISEMIAFLNDFVPGTVTGTSSVDSKFPVHFPPTQHGVISIRSAEWLAWKYGCTILGGVFIAYLQSYGVIPYQKVMARVKYDDRVFFEIVYPDFVGFFDEPRKTAADQTPFLEGVHRNNSGLYTVLTVKSHSVDDITLMRQMAYLKRVFRFAAKTYIPFKKGTVRDNLVHSPESMAELKSHGLLFAQRMV